MAKYPVVRIDNMSGTKNPENLVSLRYFVGDTKKLQFLMVLLLNWLVLTGERGLQGSCSCGRHSY